MSPSARSLGYAPTESKPVTGINAIAAPVFDYSGQMQLVITVIGPMGVLDVGPASAYTKALLGFTHRLSAQLGYIASCGRRDGPGRSRAGRKRRNSGEASPSRLSFPNAIDISGSVPAHASRGRARFFALMRTTDFRDLRLFAICECIRHMLI